MNQLQLQKLETELILKSQLLEAREKIVINAENANSELLKLNEILEQETTTLKKNRDSTKNGLDSILVERRGTIKSLEDDILSLQKQKTAIEGSISHADAQFKQENDVLNLIKNDIKESQEYLKTQEASVETAIEMANSRLLELKDNIGDLEDQLSTLVEDKKAQDELIYDKTIQISELDAEIKELRKEYETKEKRAESRLQVKQTELDELDERLKNTQQQISAELISLKEKELSIEAKNNAYKKQREEFEIEKRRFNSAQSLYN